MDALSTCLLLFISKVDARAAASVVGEEVLLEVQGVPEVLPVTAGEAAAAAVVDAALVPHPSKMSGQVTSLPPGEAVGDPSGRGHLGEAEVW